VTGAAKRIRAVAPSTSSLPHHRHTIAEAVTAEEIAEFTAKGGKVKRLPTAGKTSARGIA